jgi:hypothetical protein
MRRAIAVSVLIALLPCLPEARADELFPGAARAIPLGDSASRDAPVVELAYGPTLQASLGGEIGVVRRSRPQFDYRLSLSGLAAYELQTTAFPPPEFLRTIVGITAAFAFRAPVAMGGLFEVSIGLDGGWATTVGPTEMPGISPGNIPFGGGGVFLLPAVAWRRDLGAWQLTARISERIDLPTLLLIFDQRTLADLIAGFIGDSYTNVPAADFVVRWRVTPRWQPLLSLHGEVLFPEDPTARTGWYVRAMLGLAITGLAGEVIPFTSADIGNGQGLLLNDREARFSVGVRYVAF